MCVRALTNVFGIRYTTMYRAINYAEPKLRIDIVSL